MSPYRFVFSVEKHKPARLVQGLVSVLLISAWAGSAACASFTDALGREISIAAAPKKIVTLAPSLTEIVYFLGLGRLVAGVTTFSTHPPEAAEKPKVGSYVDLNVERIISLSPDLVLGTADGNQPAVIALLERAGLPVFVVNPRNVRQVIDTVVTIGRVCGVADRAISAARRLSSQVDAIVNTTAPLAKPLVFAQINAKPVMTVNKNTFLHDLIRLAGGTNLASDEPMTYPRISLEAVIQRRPEVIIISSMERGGAFAAIKQSWMQWPIIPAVNNNRVHLVNSDLIDRPSPRIIQGLALLAMLVHPEVDWAQSP